MTQLKEIRGNIEHQTFLESTGNAASTGNLPAFVARRKCTITGVALIPSASITADGTNYAVYTLTRHTAAAAAATTATRSWIATNSVALTEEAMTLGAGVSMAVNDTLTIIKTAAGTGLVIPACLLVITYQLAGV